ncbi:type IV pilus modification protein PilV [Herbaspirillum lusitanum]|uniref:Type IV pilus modification protein PilV n=1 Tax=Herbaspirillum lusitanum TaxID=213312 RepID=A0ABW9A3V0_9BURK
MSTISTSKFSFRISSGFSLIEVLIAMLVLSSAALGMIALQLHSLRMSRDSLLHTSAMQLAAELADMISSLPAQAMAGEPYLFSIDSTQPVPPTGNCYRKRCAPEQYLDFELRDWQRRVLMLPAARAVVCRDSSPWRQDSLQWDCDRQPSAALVIKIGWRAGSAHAAGGKDPQSAPQFVLPVGEPPR